MSEITKIKHVYGNVLRIAIPLTLRNIDVVDGEVVTSDTDFIPSSNYPVTVTFRCHGRVKRFVAEMQGNVARVYDNGTLPVGDWSITIKCRDDEGRPYRFKRRSTVTVYECTVDAGIKQPIDFDSKVWYLDAAIYLDIGGGSSSETDPVFMASPAAGIAQGDINNWNSKTSNTGTITGITMNGVILGTSGNINLGTVITQHQDITGKQDVLVSGTNIKTINGQSVLGSGDIDTLDASVDEDIETLILS